MSEKENCLGCNGVEKLHLAIKKAGLTLDDMIERRNKTIKIFEEKLDQAEDFAKERYEICKGCENFKPTYRTCKKCFCFMPVKVTLKWASCPVEKWDRIPEPPSKFKVLKRKFL